MSPVSLQGPRQPPRSGIAPRQLILFLHGLGADGNDLIGLAPRFAETLPDAEFLSPHAPFPCDMAPFGRQWFSLQDRSPAALAKGLDRVRPILDAYIDAQLAERGLSYPDLALVGFSQGTMLSLFCALRRPSPIAALVGYSGLLAAPERLAAEITARPPVLLVHGTEDAVIDYSFLARARDGLAAEGVPVSTLSCPGLGHSIDEQGLARGIQFVAGEFAKKQA